MLKLDSTLLVDLLLLMIFSIFLVIGLSYNYDAALLPLVVAIPGLIFALAQLASDLIRRKGATDPGRIEIKSELPPKFKKPHSIGAKGEKISLPDQLRAIAWVLSFFGGVLLIGFHLTIIAFVFVFLYFYSRRGLLVCVILTAVCWTSVYIIFGQALGIVLYDGIFIGYLKNAFNF